MTLPASGPGRLLERSGDAAPRGMTVHDRTRLIGRLRHSYRHRSGLRPRHPRAFRSRDQGLGVRRRHEGGHWRLAGADGKSRRTAGSGSLATLRGILVESVPRLPIVSISGTMRSSPTLDAISAARPSAMSRSRSDCDAEPNSQNLRRIRCLWIKLEQFSQVSRKSLTPLTKIPPEAVDNPVRRP